MLNVFINAQDENFDSKYFIIYYDSIELLKCDVKLSETVNFCETIEEAEGEEGKESPKEPLLARVNKKLSLKTRNCGSFMDNRSSKKSLISQQYLHNY